MKRLTGRILLLSDAPTMRASLSILLAEQRHELIVPEGTSALASDRVELVLLHAPGVDGLLPLHTLHEMGRLPALPVVVLAADERTREAALRLHAACVLTVPVDPRELGHVLSRELEFARLRAGEEQRATLLSTIPHLLFRFDREKRLLDVAASDPSRLTFPPDVSGTALNEVFEGLDADAAAQATPESSARRCAAAIAASLETGEMRIVEYALGSEWFEARMVPCGDEQVLAIARNITVERESRRALAENLARFDLLVNAGPTVTYACGALPPHTPTFISANVADLLGYEPSAFLDDASFWAANVHPDDLEHATEGVHQVIEHGRHIHEYRFRHRDGSYRWMRDELRLLRDPAGRPAEVIGAWADITSKRSLEERHRQAQTMAVIGNWELDLSSNALWWSEQNYRIFEMEHDQFDATYDAFLDRIHPDDRDLVTGIYAESLAKKTPYQIVHRLKMPDGRIKYVEERCETDYAPETGSPLRSRGTTQDVTDRVLAEQALHDNEERLRLALEASAQGTWELDLVIMHSRYDAAYAAMLGYHPDELPGEDADAFSARLHPDDRSAVWAKFEAHIAGKESKSQQEFRLRTKDGTYKWIVSNSDVIERDAAGRATRIIGTHADIDERKLAELRIASALREKEILLREVHHRVKNNLQIISSLLHFQAKKMRRPEDIVAFDGARSRLRAMTLLHEKLHRSDNLSRIDLGDYIRSIVTEIQSSSSHSDAKLEVNVEPLLLPAGIAQPTGMIVNELVTNALKYAFDDGRPNGRVEVSSKRGPGNAFELSIEDNGIGLPAGALSPMPSTFGLTLVKSLAVQLGATIAFSEGPGLRVSVHVPLDGPE